MLATGKAVYPIGEGGGEIVGHDLLEGLSGEGMQCEGFGLVDLAELPRLNRLLRGLKKDLRITSRESTLLNHSGELIRYPQEVVCQYALAYEVHMALGDTFTRSLSRRIRSFRPDAVIIQGERCAQIRDVVVKKGVFPILYVHNGFELQYFSRPRELPLVLANSRYIKNKIHREQHVDCELLYPAINLDNYDVASNSHRYITMMNPVIPKGIRTFLEVAATLRDREFLVVEGWGTSRDVFDLIKKFPNVTYLSRQSDMRRVYGQTHILLVPSQWEEAFGRVIIEAQVSGIPVVASHRGGIPEALGDGGILVDDFSNPQAWIRSIEEAEDGYDDYAIRAKENVTRFGVKTAVDTLLAILSNY